MQWERHAVEKKITLSVAAMSMEVNAGRRMIPVVVHRRLWL
jgi:hypothetical protein